MSSMKAPDRKLCLQPICQVFVVVCTAERVGRYMQVGIFRSPQPSFLSGMMISSIDVGSFDQGRLLSVRYVDFLTFLSMSKKADGLRCVCCRSRPRPFEVKRVHLVYVIFILVRCTVLSCDEVRRTVPGSTAYIILHRHVPGVKCGNGTDRIGV